MLLYAKQPQWIDHMGESIWNVMQKLSKILRSNFLLGMLWAFMPCGLLYSALLVAALTLNILNGSLSMMFFAAGTSISLIVSPIIWLKIKNGKFLASFGAPLSRKFYRHKFKCSKVYGFVISYTKIQDSAPL